MSFGEEKEEKNLAWSRSEEQAIADMEESAMSV